MKKYIIEVFVWVCLLGFSSAMQAQNLSLKKIFVAMPDSLCPLLTEVNRADCIDFLDSGMKARVKNRLDGVTEMTELNDSYLKLQMTSSTTWQMKLLQVNDSTQIVCVVRTFNGPACDSDIQFFTTDWKKKLDADKYFPYQFTIDDFLLKTEGKELEDISESIKKADLNLVAFELSADSDSLSVRLATPDYMEKEMAEKLKPFIRHSIKYIWKEGRFE